MYPNYGGSLISNMQKPQVVSEPEKENKKETDRDIKKIFKDLLNIFAKSLMFHDNASLICHGWGLQGHKRMHRCYSRKAANEMQCYQHYFIDLFGETVEPDWDQHYEFPMSDLKQYMQTYYLTESAIRTDLSNIVCELLDCGYAHESKMVQCSIHPYIRHIEKSRRWSQDFEKSEWSWAYIRVLDAQLHEKYKKKEKKQGYRG